MINLKDLNKYFTREKDSEKELEKAKRKEERKTINNNKKIIKKFSEHWIEEMAHLGLYNSLDETYTLRDMSIRPYGFVGKIENCIGLSLDKLNKEEIKKSIEDELQCKMFLKEVPFKNYLEVKFLTNDNTNFEYKPMKLEPYELYMPCGLDGEPIVVSMIEYPHMVLQGSNGMGKTKFLDAIMVNLIETNSTQKVMFYIIQADKADQIIYRKCKHVKAYAEKVKDIAILTSYILDEVEKINEMLKPLIEDGKCTNVYEYNKLVRENKVKGNEIPYRYVLIDEYSSLMPDGENNKEMKAYKEIIQNNMERIMQIARSTGCFCLLSTQRATVDNMPAFVKRMANTVATFRVNGKISADVAGIEGAERLEPRYFMVLTKDIKYGKTANIPQELIHSIVKKYRSSSVQKFPFKKYEYLLKGTSVDKTNYKKIKETLKKEEVVCDEKQPITTCSRYQLKEKTKEIKTDIKEEKETIKSHFDIKEKPTKSRYYIPDYVDPTKDKNIKVIDERNKNYMTIKSTNKENK